MSNSKLQTLCLSLYRFFSLLQILKEFFRSNLNWKETLRRKNNKKCAIWKFRVLKRNTRKNLVFSVSTGFLHFVFNKVYEKERKGFSPGWSKGFSCLLLTTSKSHFFSPATVRLNCNGHLIIKEMSSGCISNPDHSQHQHHL